MNINLRVPKVFHRDYRQDFDSTSKRWAIRLTRIALPFLTLYKPLARPVAIAASSLRAYNSSGWIGKVAAISSVAGFILFPAAGYAVTTLQDSAGNITRIYGALREKRKQDAALETLYLANNIFYLATMLCFGAKLQLASLAVQVVVSGLSSASEFKKDNCLEASACALFTALRIHQAIPLAQRVQREWVTERKIQRVHVGKLKELWQYPSDHLPVGAEVNKIKIVSWNVLNNAYMKWVIETDDQGLNGSMITDLHKPAGDGLTLRERKVVQMVTEMTAPNHVIALQECSSVFISRLQKALPDNWKLIRSSDRYLVDQDVVLFNENALSYKPERSEVPFDAYPSHPHKPIQNLYFETLGGSPLRIFNTHIPGDPALPCRQEFANYVRTAVSDYEPTVVVGDNNFERGQMEEAYTKAGFSDFEILTPWRTNVDPVKKESKGIDHIFVMNADTRPLTSQELETSEAGLQQTIDLLGVAR